MIHLCGNDSFYHLLGWKSIYSCCLLGPSVRRAKLKVPSHCYSKSFPASQRRWVATEPIWSWVCVPLYLSLSPLHSAWDFFSTSDLVEVSKVSGVVAVGQRLCPVLNCDDHLLIDKWEIDCHSLCPQFTTMKLMIRATGNVHFQIRQQLHFTAGMIYCQWDRLRFPNDRHLNSWL